MFGSLGSLLSSGMNTIGSSLGSLGSLFKEGLGNFMNGANAATLAAAPKGVMGGLGQILGAGKGGVGLMSSLGSLGKMYTDYAGLQDTKALTDHKLRLEDANFNNQVNSINHKKRVEVYQNLLNAGVPEEEARLRADAAVADLGIQGV